MPGKKYKSIGIREKLYERIEREKKEGESISDYVDRIIDMAIDQEKGEWDGKNLVIQPYEPIGDANEPIEALRRDIASLTVLSKEDLKKALLGLENDIDMKIRDMLNEVTNKL